MTNVLAGLHGACNMHDTHTHNAQNGEKLRICHRLGPCCPIGDGPYKCVQFVDLGILVALIRGELFVSPWGAGPEVSM